MRHVLRTLLLLTTPVLWAFAPMLHAQAGATYSFGLSLAPGANSELFSLFIVKEYQGEVLGTEPLSRDQFMLQAQGVVPSKANPEKVNLMRAFNVTKCLKGEPSDSIVMLGCEVFDDIWKLRFWEYPYLIRDGSQPGQGWAEKREAPSPRQLLILTEYGFVRLSGMARGDNVFRLLHDMCDEAWVDRYRRGS